MNSEEFEVNGRMFIRSTYLDISVLIDKETGYYYAQKICDDNDKRLENLLQNNDYELMKQAVASTTGIPVVELEITFPGMPVGYRSKWVHKLLVNYIAQWANKEYAVKIAMLLNLIDERIKIENRTLQQEINTERRLVEQLQTDNGNLNRQVNELQQQNQTIIAQNNQLLEDNRHTHQQLHQANHKLDSLGHQINGLTNSFTSNFSEMNVTTGTAEYTYLLLTRQALTNGARRNGKIAADFSIFDSICCLKKDRQRQLLAHNFNQDTDVIEFEFECGSSLDMYKFISTNFSKLYCKYINSGEYRRKIAYVTNRKEQIIDKIRQYIERGSQNRFSIIERLDRLQDTVNDIETRVASIEDFFMYLRHKGTFVIDGKTIRRVLNRDIYHNLYINLDGSRHTLTLDELNNATFE